MKAYNLSAKNVNVSGIDMNGFMMGLGKTRRVFVGCPFGIRNGDDVSLHGTSESYFVRRTKEPSDQWLMHIGAREESHWGDYEGYLQYLVCEMPNSNPRILSKSMTQFKTAKRSWKYDEALIVCKVGTILRIHSTEVEGGSYFLLVGEDSILQLREPEVLAKGISTDPLSYITI